MTRKELLKAMNDRGVPLRTWTLDKLSANGLIPEAEYVHSTQKVYTQAHVEAIENYFSNRKSRRK